MESNTIRFPPVSFLQQQFFTSFKIPQSPSAVKGRGANLHLDEMPIVLTYLHVLSELLAAVQTWSNLARRHLLQIFPIGEFRSGRSCLGHKIAVPSTEDDATDTLFVLPSLDEDVPQGNAATSMTLSLCPLIVYCNSKVSRFHILHNPSHEPVTSDKLSQVKLHDDIGLVPPI